MLGHRTKPRNSKVSSSAPQIAVRVPTCYCSRPLCELLCTVNRQLTTCNSPTLTPQLSLARTLPLYL